MYKHRCKKCDIEFESKKSDAKYCSKSCVWEDKGWSSENNTTCTNCKTEFHMKLSAKKRYKRTHGYFCSNVCVGEFRSGGVYTGSKNPNYRGVTHDSDGYRIYVPHLSSVTGLKRMKLHQAVCCETLGIKKIGRGFHVHHRDCDIENNKAENLVVLNISDHKWLHKQYGVATLWANFHGKISTQLLISWSDNKNRAARLLNLNVIKQNINDIGFVLNGELTLKENNNE